ncbi:MAG: roadblock/LC7 domain-containing protein [Halobacteria archaeon]
MMDYKSPELQAHIEEVVKVSRGLIDAIIITKPDGTPVANVNSIDINPDYLAAAISAVSGVISSVLEVMEMGDFRRAHVELKDKRYLYVVPYKGDYVALITKPNPNLGFIDLLLDIYFKEV